MELKLHPVTSLMPEMSAQEYEALKADIAANGLLEPLWIDDAGNVIDGRHRLRVCSELGIEPRVQVWAGRGSLVDFVVGLNSCRRHLNESQRAMVAAKAKPMYASEPHSGKVAVRAASALNVGRATVEQAEAVLRDAAPELVKAVENGDAKIAHAYAMLDLPKEEQAQAVANGPKAIKIASQDAKWRKRAGKLIEEATPLNDSIGKFSVILADPPWQYQHPVSDSRDIENQYPTMALSDIENLPIQPLLTEDAILFLWCPPAKVAEACGVMSKWGFDFRSCAVWVKPSIGPGYYFRAQHELILVGVHGKPITPAPENRVSSIINAPRREHSQKPEELYEIIEKGWPELPKLELFGRGPTRPNWVKWGNEV